MGTNFAILGWGSLLWDRRDEFDQQHGEWRFDGPVLKLEFSRISKSRLGALTLVIDPVNGYPARVAYCISRRTVLADVICDLRCREGTVLAKIGYFQAIAGENRHRDTESYESICTWTRAKNLDAVVWTDLASNFEECRRERFSVEAAVEYLRGLPAESAAKSTEYFERAPDFVRTPLREALRQPGVFPAVNHWDEK